MKRDARNVKKPISHVSIFISCSVISFLEKALPKRGQS